MILLDSYFAYPMLVLLFFQLLIANLFWEMMNTLSLFSILLHLFLQLLYCILKAFFKFIEGIFNSCCEIIEILINSLKALSNSFNYWIIRVHVAAFVSKRLFLSQFSRRKNLEFIAVCLIGVI